jgi:hypothetical protein
VRIFRCDHCGHPVFFENVQCLHCGSALAFLPDRMFIAAIEPCPDEGLDTTGEPFLWRRKSPRHADRQYRMCHNHGTHQACNFAVPAHDPNPLCVSCRQTRILPDLTIAANQERWYRIEVAQAPALLHAGPPGPGTRGPAGRPAHRGPRL